MFTPPPPVPDPVAAFPPPPPTANFAGGRKPLVPPPPPLYCVSYVFHSFFSPFRVDGFSIFVDIVPYRPAKINAAIRVKKVADGESVWVGDFRTPCGKFLKRAPQAATALFSCVTRILYHTPTLAADTRTTFLPLPYSRRSDVALRIDSRSPGMTSAPIFEMRRRNAKHFGGKIRRKPNPKGAQASARRRLGGLRPLR